MRRRRGLPSRRISSDSPSKSWPHSTSPRSRGASSGLSRPRARSPSCARRTSAGAASRRSPKRCGWPTASTSRVSNGSTWAITARGFNISHRQQAARADRRADALLAALLRHVLGRRRTRCSTDLDRIEVIRGPGGTIWGANAVNGVINIITQDRVADRRAAMLRASTGTDERRDHVGAVRRADGTGPGTTASSASIGRARPQALRERRAARTTRCSSGRAVSGSIRNARGRRAGWCKGPATSAPAGSGRPRRRRRLAAATCSAAGRGGSAARAELQVAGLLRLHAPRWCRCSSKSTAHTGDVDAQHQCSSAPGTTSCSAAQAAASRPRRRPRHRRLLVRARSAGRTAFSDVFVQDEFALGRDRLYPDARLEVRAQQLHRRSRCSRPSRMRRQARRSGRCSGAPSRGRCGCRRGSTPTSGHRRATGRCRRSSRPRTSRPSPSSPTKRGYRVRPHAAALARCRRRSSTSTTSLRSQELRRPAARRSCPRQPAQRRHQRRRSRRHACSCSPRGACTASYAWLRSRRSAFDPGSTRSDGRRLRKATIPPHCSTLRSYLDLPHGLALDAIFRYAGRAAVSRSCRPTRELDLRLGWTPRPGWELSVVGQNLLHAQPSRNSASPAAPLRVPTGVSSSVRIWQF